jgi:hypothetical protein
VSFTSTTFKVSRSEKQATEIMNSCSVGLKSVLSIVLATAIGYAQQSRTFNFDSEAAGKGPAGFTSYATGGGPAGKWVVMEMNDAPSGKAVVVQTDADSTDTRFPVLVADGGEYADLDASM